MVKETKEFRNRFPSVYKFHFLEIFSKATYQMTEKYEDIEKPTEDILYSLDVANAYFQIILYSEMNSSLFKFNLFREYFEGTIRDEGES